MTFFRGGAVLLEAVAATVLLAIFLAGFLPLVVASRQLERDTVRRHVALQEALNVIEHLHRTRWEDLSDDGLKPWRLSDEAAAWLPGAVLQLHLIASEGPPAAKSVLVEIARPDQAGQLVPLARLRTWRYAKGAPSHD